MSRSAVFVWVAIAGLSVVLFAGAYLGLTSIADASAAKAGGVASGDVRIDRDLQKYVAPPNVCPGATDLTATIPAQVETELCLINYARYVHGVGPVVPNDKLMLSAALKAGDIARCGEFSHQACGSEVRQRFAETGYFGAQVDTKYGENLAWGGAEAGSPRGVLVGWLESPEHRANLLRGDWNEHGLALVHVRAFRGVADSRIWVSHFGRRG